MTAPPGSMMLPEPPTPPAQDTIWHYTTAEGLLAILQQDTIWSTTASMLNDSREISYGIEFFDILAAAYLRHSARRQVEEHFIHAVIDYSKQLIQTNRVYLLCASLHGDSLSQWRSYAGAGGYAIGLVVGGGLNLRTWSEPPFPRGDINEPVAQNAGRGGVC